MRLSRFLAGLVASALLIAAFSLGGCAGRPAPAVDLPARPEFPPNAPVPAAEIEKARSVLERYLIAYSKGDVETVLKTVPRAKAEGYRASGEQMARCKGMKIKSIRARPSTDRIVQSAWPDYVNLRIGYKAVVVFKVEVEYPNSTDDDVLLEDFSAFMVRTPGGRWLYIDAMAI